MEEVSEPLLLEEAANREAEDLELGPPPGADGEVHSSSNEKEPNPSYAPPAYSAPLVWKHSRKLGSELLQDMRAAATEAE